MQAGGNRLRRCGQALGVMAMLACASAAAHVGVASSPAAAAAAHPAPPLRLAQAPADSAKASQAAPADKAVKDAADARKRDAEETAGRERYDRRVGSILLGGFFVLFLLLLGGVALLQWRYQRAIEKVLDADASRFGNDGQAARQAKVEALGILQASPLGIPEGSVRAILSFILIVGGLMILMFREQLNLGGAAEIASILGTVLGFYFGSRSTSDPGTAQISRKTDEIRADVAKANVAIQTTQAEIRATATPTVAAAQQERVSSHQRDLAALRDKLRVAQQMVRVLGGSGEGATIIDNASTVLDQGDRLLAVIEPLLSGKPDLKELADVTQQASAALGEMRKFGLPGIFGDAIATAQAVAGTLSGGLSTGAALAGVVGGPAGLIGGLVLSGLKLYSDRQAFDRYEAILLQRPFDRKLLPETISGNEALLVLEYAPLMMARLRAKGAVGPDLAITVLNAALKSDGATPRPARSVAAELLARDELKGMFAGEDELAEAIEEYRASAVFKFALQDLPQTLELDGDLPGAPARRTVDLHQLLALIPLLRGDRRMAAEIDRIYTVVRELAGQKVLPAAEVSGLIVGALAEAQSIAASSRQLREAPAEVQP